MNKDAPAIPVDERDGIIATAARRKTCLVILLLGATVGVLVGILNLLSMHNQWALQDDFFDIVDAPITPLMSGPLVNLGPGYGLVWIFYSLKLAFILICYWAAIGLFLASVICFVCSGLRRDIARDKICRYILFFGTCGGIFVGSLSFLAASNGWGNLENFFGLPQPAGSFGDRCPAGQIFYPGFSSAGSAGGIYFQEHGGRCLLDRHRLARGIALLHRANFQKTKSRKKSAGCWSDYSPVSERCVWASRYSGAEGKVGRVSPLRVDWSAANQKR